MARRSKRSGQRPAGRGPWLWLRRLASWAVLLCGAALVLLVADGLIDRLEEADAILVLGNTVQPDGQPSPRLAARLDRALEAYQMQLAPVVIVSGAVSKEGHDEAAVMRDWLVARGVPKTAIVLDGTGFTTWDSARNARTWLDEQDLGENGRVLVVSQFFHLSRARLALKKHGIREVGSARARFIEPRDAYSTLRELPAWLRDAVRSAD